MSLTRDQGFPAEALKKDIGVVPVGGRGEGSPGKKRVGGDETGRENFIGLSLTHRTLLGSEREVLGVRGLKFLGKIRRRSEKRSLFERHGRTFRNFERPEACRSRTFDRKKAWKLGGDLKVISGDRNKKGKGILWEMAVQEVLRLLTDHHDEGTGRE